MRHVLKLAVGVLLLWSAAALPAFAQGGAVTTSLSGTVVDSTGAVIPGADVTATMTATGAVSSAVTGANGAFNIPALQPGSYKVTVVLMGFKTWVANNVVLAAAIPGTVKVTLEVGGLEETVTVTGGAEIVQTTSTSVATTINVQQIVNLPIGSRSALNIASLLPGVDTATTLRAGNILGLPQAAVNITLDGMNIQDNYNKTNEIFTRVSPRLDAVEEVTFTSAAQGADAGGGGAVQIRFATRSGTNQLRGSGYFYYQDDALNGNTWFNKRNNLPKPEFTLYQPGIRLGGPVVIPKVFDGRNRLFFFVNYEEERQPRSITNDRTMLVPAAVQGNFLYNTSSGVRSVNLYQLAAQFGQTSTPDPIILKLLNDINAASLTTGTITALTNPSTQRLTWAQDGESLNRYPTVRVDYNLSDRHRIFSSYNYQHIWSSPDTTNSRQVRFPGFPHYGIQDSERYSWQGAWRATVGRNLVNEFRVGMTGGATMFNPNWGPDMYTTSGVGNMNGYNLNINGAMAIANPTSQAATSTRSSREAFTRVVENALNWQVKSHSLAIGASFTRVGLWQKANWPAPTVNFGIVSGDPAQSMFTATTLPGSSGTDRTNAQNLYAMLTGRISSIDRQARIDPATDKYVVMGESLAEGHMHDLGFYVQDSWRVRSNITVNAGLRYVVQLPFTALNGSYSNASVADVFGVTGLGSDFVPGSLVSGIGNLFKPGVLQGSITTYDAMTKGTKAYNTDWNNWAPNIGVAWTPQFQKGFLATILGDPGDSVFRAGFSTAFQRNGMGDFSGVFASNPGLTIDATRSLGNANLGSIPVLFRQPDTLGAPSVQETRTYPMLPPGGLQTGSVNIFDPDLQVPFARTWTAGWQRALTKNMAIELRYVGTHNYDGWTEYDYNEININENGFLNEFKLAQANLQANIAAGRGANFKYYGAGTGTSPLPIFLAYFNGSADASNPARYTSSDFSSNTFLNPLAIYNPLPFTAATNLDSTAARRANAIQAGLPANFLVVNPDMLGGANITGNGGYTTYNGFQAELRKRMSGGLQFQANYSFAISHDSNRYSFRVPRLKTRQTGEGGGVTHAVKLNWVYELPFGRGRRWLKDASPLVEAILGRWAFYGTGVVQSGRLLDFGNVRLVGMSTKEFLDAFQLRKVEDASGVLRVWMLPDDIINETVKAFNTSATSLTGYGSLGAPSGRYVAPAGGPDCLETISTGYGECGTRTLVVTGPIVHRFDFSVAKQIPIKGRINAEFRAEVFNVFNKVNFTPIVGVGSTTASGFEVTGARDQQRTSQLVFRINW